MVSILVAIGVALAALAAEWLHARRIARVRTLAFGRLGEPRTWIASLPFVRAGAMGLLAWAVLTLLAIDGAPSDRAQRDKQPVRHLLIALDVSPSMYLPDAGPEGGLPRGRRAYDVLESVLHRLDVSHTRVSVVAFYTTAKPVVVDTDDINVVENIIRDLPLEHAFKEGQTNMYEGVRAAAALAETWPPASATLIVVSDGDTLTEAGLPTMPQSITDTIVLGVGNPYRGSQIAGRTSRQDAASLKRLALRLGGVYHDGNAHHLPTAVLDRLRMLTLESERQTELRTIALVATGLSTAAIASISPALALAGIRYHRREPLPSRARPPSPARATAPAAMQPA